MPMAPMALAMAALLGIPMVVTVVTLPLTSATLPGTECPMVPTLSESAEPPLPPSQLLLEAMLELEGNKSHLQPFSHHPTNTSPTITTTLSDVDMISLFVFRYVATSAGVVHIAKRFVK